MPQESGTPTAQLAGKKRKRRSRWSDAPPSATQSSTSASGGTADSTDDDALIAKAMASFIEQSSSPGPQYGRQASIGTGGQQLSHEQLLQIKEQIAVRYHCVVCSGTSKKGTLDHRKKILRYL